MFRGALVDGESARLLRAGDSEGLRQPSYLAIRLMIPDST